MVADNCSWCDHEMFGVEDRGRIRIDEQPNQCADCSEWSNDQNLWMSLGRAA